MSSHPDLEALRLDARTGFAARFGREPAWLVAAPGRVNLIGEHTDYTGGYVLPMAVERYTVIAGAPNPGGRLTLVSAQMEREADISLSDPLKMSDPGWANYVTGVLQGFIDLGETVPGFEAYSVSSVPLGGGLSSSASLEVATAMLLLDITGRKADVAELARICQRAEQNFAGVPCGIMDQYISLAAKPGQALLLDCRDLGSKDIPMDGSGVSVLITDCGVRHDLTDGIYADRRHRCEEAERIMDMSIRDVSKRQLDETALDPLLRKRVHHVVHENDRTRRTATALAMGDWVEAGELMYESHESLRHDFEVSIRELDLLVDAHRSIGARGGVHGCRMTGGGFGGCTVALVNADAAETVGKQVAQSYHAATGIEVSPFISRPSPGALALRAG